MRGKEGFVEKVHKMQKMFRSDIIILVMDIIYYTLIYIIIIQYADCYGRN